MKRRTPTILALVLVLGVAALAYHDSQQRKAQSRAAAAEKSTALAEPAGTKVDEAPKENGSEQATSDAEIDVSSSTRFHTMPDGSPIAALPESAPQRIKLGVALFRYKGAQGTSESTRSRTAAEALAKEAIEIAKKDFAEAVKKGDRGSQENIGWMKQRVLERSVEHAVFSLAEGEISGSPIDTPRGFWVAKRLR